MAPLDGGLNRYDPATDTFQHYRNDPNDPTSIQDDYVNHIFEDSQGRFWVATRGGTLSLFDRNSGTCVTHYTHDPQNPQSIPAFDSIRAILEDRREPGILWIGTLIGNGLIRFDTQAETFKLYPADPAQPDSLHDADIYGIYQDDAGILWFCTASAGLEQFDTTTEIFTHYPAQPDDPQSLASNQLWEAHEFTPNTLWIATVGGGLNLFDKRTGIVTRLNKSTGFPVNTILTMRPDQAGNIWMGTDEGLLKYSIATGATRLYTKGDGLQGNVFIDQAAAVMPDGEMWFGGSGGISRFYPEQIVDNPYVPPVILTALKQQGEPMNLPAAPERLRELRLDWRHNFFEFEFAALNYILPEKNQYKYKLEGLEQDWYDAGAKRYARYAGLPDGTYTLRVIGANNDGVWNEQGTSLRVTVIPPYWRTWWFYTLCAFAGAGVLGLVYRTQVKIRTEAALHQAAVREKEAAEREKIAAQREKDAADAANRAKSEFLSHMSHELRTPLNGILGYARILQMQAQLPAKFVNYLDIMQSSGAHLLNLINDVLDLGKIEAQKMDVQIAPFNLRSVLQQVVNITKIAAEEKDLLVAYERDTALPDMVSGDEGKVRQILLNLLNNAIKYTQAGSITVRASYAPDTQRWHCAVIDTGVGIPPEQLDTIFAPFTRLDATRRTADGVGLGLSITKHLIALLDGTLSITSTPDVGSAFTVELPLPLIEDRDRADHAAPQQILGYGGPRKRVLAVDDNVTNLAMLAALLEPLGFQMTTATNGADAARKAAAEPPDVVLLDFVMPDMDGLDTLEQLRTQADSAAMPVIGISATALEKARHQQFRAECQAFLKKPIDVDGLLDALRDLLAITWEYSAAQADAPDADAAPLVLPPAEALAQLRHDASIGNFVALTIVLDRLAADNSAYAPFCEAVRVYAERYDDDGMLAYIEQAERSAG